jgi:glycosyltransferase involved in cell wall biosynthesis
MKPQPLVSVIVPVYNTERYLSLALESARGQTYRNLEIIVVDDGSTDGSAEVAERHAAEDPRVHVVRQTNAGVASARNHGLRVARGELIAPLDADDLWHPTKVQWQVARMHEAGERVGLVYCWYSRVDPDGRMIQDIASSTLEGRVLERIIEQYWIGSGSNAMIRRRCLDAVGGYHEGMRSRGGQGCEDWDLAIRLAEAFEFAVVPEYLLQYRDVPASMTGNVQQMSRSFDVMMQDLLKRRNDIPRRVVRRARANFLYYIAKACAGKGLRGQAAVGLIRSVVASPLDALTPRNCRDVIVAVCRPAARRHGT